LSTAPSVDINMSDFWADPYPIFAALRKNAPIAYVPQLGGTLLCKRDDIFVSEKKTDIFSSDQPAGLMTRLMGQNMMRKDGNAHMSERKQFFPAVSPRAVATHWVGQFRTHADRIINALPHGTTVDFVDHFALPFSAECLKSITGLTNIRFQDMNAWSQAMIDGISNYSGDPSIEGRCHAATAGIDAAIDDMLPVVQKRSDKGLLGILISSGMSVDSVRANIKLAISGGQNEPRDAIAGTIWALLTHPDQLAMVKCGEISWLQAFEEYARWISPIGMSPRRIVKPWKIGEIEFQVNDRAFLMYGSANRDEGHFDKPDCFDLQRDTSKSVAFGAGPHFCAGAWASRAMIAEVALPMIFSRFDNLRIDEAQPVRVGGWAFRGLLNLPLTCSMH
jgi:cytochrome P450